jgi:hypothetical protein
MRRPRSGRGATAASGPGVGVTPEARSPAACSCVLRCAASKCPPPASVESADAARRPEGAHERPMGVRRDRRYGHRCPHTFCPLTHSVKSRRTRSDLDRGVLVRGGLTRRRRDSQAGQTMRYRYSCVTALADCRGNGGVERPRGVQAAGEGLRRAAARGPAAWAGRPGRTRVRPALARTPMACHPRDLRSPLTSERHRAGSFLDNDVGRVGFGSHGNR